MSMGLLVVAVLLIIAALVIASQSQEVTQALQPEGRPAEYLGVQHGVQYVAIKRAGGSGLTIDGIDFYDPMGAALDPQVRVDVAAYDFGGQPLYSAAHDGRARQEMRVETVGGPVAVLSITYALMAPISVSRVVLRGSKLQDAEFVIYGEHDPHIFSGRFSGNSAAIERVLFEARQSSAATTSGFCGSCLKPY